MERCFYLEPAAAGPRPADRGTVLPGGLMIEIRHKDSGAVLRTFNGESLAGEYMEGAKLAGADLSKRDLQKADLQRADLRDADLSGANLKARCSPGADARGDLRRRKHGKGRPYRFVRPGRRLSRRNLNGAIMRYAKLSEADFSESSLVGADMSMAELGCDFSRANLMKADLRGSILAGAVMDGATLLGANLTDAKLAGADMSGARLEGAIMAVGRKLGVGGFKKKEARPWWQFWG